MECFDFTVGSAPTCIREFQTNVSNLVCNLSNQLRPQAHQLRLTNKLPFIYLLTFTFLSFLSFLFPTQRHNASLFFSFFILFVYFKPCWTCPASACVSHFLGPQPCGEHRANYSFAFFLSHFLGLCFYSFVFFFFASHFTPGLVVFKVWDFGLPIGALSFILLCYVCFEVKYFRT